MADAGPSYDEDDSQRRPDDPAHFAGQVHSAGHGSARQVRQYRKSRGDQIGNAIFSVLAWAGLAAACGQQMSRPDPGPGENAEDRIADLVAAALAVLAHLAGRAVPG